MTTTTPEPSVADPAERPLLPHLRPQWSDLLPLARTISARRLRLTSRNPFTALVRAAVWYVTLIELVGQHSVRALATIDGDIIVTAFPTTALGIRRRLPRYLFTYLVIAFVTLAVPLLVISGLGLLLLTGQIRLLPFLVACYGGLAGLVALDRVGTGGGGGLAIFSLPVRIKLALRGHRVIYVSNLVGPRDRSLRVTALVDALLALANQHGYTIVATAANKELIEVYERNGFILARPHSRRSRQMYRPPNAPRYRRAR